MAQRYTSLRDRKSADVFGWGTIQWLVNAKQFPGGNITFGFVEIEPGKKNTRHYHPNSSEVLYLLEGELDHSVDGELVHLTPGMAISIPQGAEHDARNTASATARMVVAYPTGDRQTVMLEEGDE